MFKEDNAFIVHPIPVLKDNIVWIWTVGNEAAVVDPSISTPIIKWLKSKKISLNAILQTHHHEDHIGGTPGLLEQWPNAKVIAAKNDLSRIPFQTQSVKGKEILEIMGYQMKIFSLPGHTSHHIAYYISEDSNTKDPILFPGDTLFSAGCGRIFEGTKEQMFFSLKELNALPKETKVYSGHEYTESNLRWATSLRPKDKKLSSRLKKVIELRKRNKLSLPSTISLEQETNLFLQAKSVKEFSSLRNHKDNWKG